MRLLTLLSLTSIAVFLSTGTSAHAQGMPLPAGTTMPVPQSPKTNVTADTPPSMKDAGNHRTNTSLGQVTSGGKLPRTAGQEHRVYDLRPYTGYLTKQDRPEQAVIDWVLRETGTDVWFTQPFGFMNADRDSLSVYHTNEMHQIISGVVDRFVAGEKDPQSLRLLVLTVGNPNWRSRAHMLMQHVTVDSPGVQAWLLSKENAAMVLNHAASAHRYATGSRSQSRHPQRPDCKNWLAREDAITFATFVPRRHGWPPL